MQGERDTMYSIKRSTQIKAHYFETLMASSTAFAL